MVLEQQYEPASSENTVQPNMEISTGMTGTTTAWSTGYTGAGMRIAIIDTGLDTSHQSFDNGAYEYALEQNAARAKESVEAYKASLDLLDADEINEKLSLLHIKEGVSAADLYRTEKVAYGYCYIDKDLDVTHETDAEGEHGSHVAGIAAANRVSAGRKRRICLRIGQRTYARRSAGCTGSGHEGLRRRGRRV